MLSNLIICRIYTHIVSCCANTEVKVSFAVTMVLSWIKRGLEVWSRVQQRTSPGSFGKKYGSNNYDPSLYGRDRCKKMYCYTWVLQSTMLRSEMMQNKHDWRNYLLAPLRHYTWYLKQGSVHPLLKLKCQIVSESSCMVAAKDRLERMNHLRSDDIYQLT